MSARGQAKKFVRRGMVVSAAVCCSLLSVMPAGASAHAKFQFQILPENCSVDVVADSQGQYHLINLDDCFPHPPPHKPPHGSPAGQGANGGGTGAFPANEVAGNFAPAGELVLPQQKLGSGLQALTPQGANLLHIRIADSAKMLTNLWWIIILICLLIILFVLLLILALDNLTRIVFGQTLRQWLLLVWHRWRHDQKGAHV